MNKLRYGALAILGALAASACGGGAGTETAGDTASSVATATPAEAPKVTGQQIADLLDDPDVFLLDVRGADELPEQGAIEGYTLIPIDELADRLDELPRDKKILTI